MARTVWLASYPKSGNTWFRIFLANLMHPELAPVDINNLPLPTPIASSRCRFDEMLGLPSALLTHAEIESLRPAADQALNAFWSEPLLIRKAHDAYTFLPDGQPLMGRSPDFSAIYILRDPWDVAVSMTHHFSCSLEEAINKLCAPHFKLAKSQRGLNNQLPQRLLTWAEHAVSWLEAPLDLHLLRYESMVADPLSNFRDAVRFLGLDQDDEAIVAALVASRIGHYQAQEDVQRFREAPTKQARFFRQGRVGEGLTALSSADLERLVSMRKCVEDAILLRGLPA